MLSAGRVAGGKGRLPATVCGVFREAVVRFTFEQPGVLLAGLLPAPQFHERFAIVVANVTRVSWIDVARQQLGKGVASGLPTLVAVMIDRELDLFVSALRTQRPSSRECA